jgi:hypothetical protein
MEMAKQGIYNVVFIDNKDKEAQARYQRVVMAVNEEHAIKKLEKESGFEIDVLEIILMGSTEEEYPVSDDDQETYEKIKAAIDEMIYSDMTFGDIFESISNYHHVTHKLYMDVLKSYHLQPEFEKGV